MKFWMKVLLAIVIISICGIGIFFLVRDGKDNKKDNGKDATDNKTLSSESTGSGGIKDKVKLMPEKFNENMVSLKINESDKCELKFDEIIEADFKEYKQGDIFIIPPHKGIPDGVAGKVDKIVDDTMYFEVPSIPEVFNNLSVKIDENSDIEVLGFVPSGKSRASMGDDIFKVDYDNAQLENGKDYLKKIGIQINDFKPMDDLMTINGEFSLEDLVIDFDFDFDINNSPKLNYDFNVYTDFTQNLSIGLKANKKIENNFEIGTLKLRTIGGVWFEAAGVNQKESRYIIPLGLDMVFMVNTSGEIYIEAKLDIVNEGYAKINNTLKETEKGYRPVTTTSMYGQNYPHDFINSASDDSSDIKPKHEASLELEGKASLALKLPIKFETKLMEMSLISATFSNGLEGDIKCNVDATFEDINSKPKFSSGDEVSVNLDFVSDFTIEPDILNTFINFIGGDLVDGFEVSWNLLDVDVFDFKYPNEDDEMFSYKTYVPCTCDIYVLVEKVITGKKKEILTPEAILKKVAKHHGIPDGVKVNSFKIKNNIAYLDLTEEMNKTVQGIVGEGIRNEVLASTFMSAYGVDGLVIHINNGPFVGGGHGSYEMNEIIKVESLIIHDSNHHAINDNSEDSGNQNNEEESGMKNPHTKEEIANAKKILDDEFIPQGMLGFKYEDGTNELAKKYMEEYILFHGLGPNDEGYDKLWAIKRGTNKIFYIYSDGMIMGYQKEKPNTNNFHTDAEIAAAKKILENTYNDNQIRFVYISEKGGIAEQLSNQYIMFYNESLDGMAADYAAAVKIGTNEVFVIFSSGEILTYAEYCERRDEMLNRPQN